MKRTAFLIALIFCLNSLGSFAQTIDPDSIELVKKQLTSVKKNIYKFMLKRRINNLLQNHNELVLFNTRPNEFDIVHSEQENKIL